MVKNFTLGLAKVYIYREKGNTWIRNKEGVSSPILFAAYDGEMEPFTVRDYMNLTGKSLVETANIMDECGVILTHHTFNIQFFDEKSVDKFIEVTLKLRENINKL